MCNGEPIQLLAQPLVEVLPSPRVEVVYRENSGEFFGGDAEEHGSGAVRGGEEAEQCRGEHDTVDGNGDADLGMPKVR